MAKTKKKDNTVKISRGWLVIGIFVMALICSYIVVVPHQESYNPDLHTCTETTITMDSKLYAGWEEECTDWRDKTFCESCHDNWIENCSEQCICDGEVGDGTLKYRYGDEVYYVRYHSWTTQVEVYNLSECYEEFNCNLTGALNDCIVFCDDNSELYIIDTVSSDISCHGETREKTECEKNNPDYVYGCGEWGILEGPDCILPHGIISPAECRKKTIYDYSCDELKEHIWLGDDYCARDNSWNGWALCGYGSYRNKELKQIYLENGCEI